MTDREVKPYSHGSSKREQVEVMFNNIAPTYDVFNHTLSLGVDRLWRRAAIKRVQELLSGKQKAGKVEGTSRLGNELDKTSAAHSTALNNVLDVATGTGDLAIQACRRLHPRSLVGIDISDGMMQVGREKVRKAGLDSVISFRNEDCSALTFADCTFDAIISSFALRNFQDIDACLHEMHRVLRPGGAIVVIDLCPPRHFPMRQIFAFYHRVLMPAYGRCFSKDAAAYRYLPKSMVATPHGKSMAQRFQQAGFTNAQHRYLHFGMCCMYSATKQ